MNFRRLSGLVLVLALVWVGLSWHAASQLSHPPRRPLQAYHSTILATPINHGIRVLEMTLSDGTPVLMCEPEHTPSTKGHRLRDELEQTGTALDAPGRIIGTLVLLHGRRGRKEDWLPAAERFCAAGFRCLMPDLPAHGDHPHHAAAYGQREAPLPAQLVRESAGHFGFAAGRPALIGLSMGGAVAIQAAALDPNLWSSLAVVSTFDKLEITVHRQACARVGRILGGIWMEGTRQAFAMQAGLPLSRIESLTAARTLRMPVLVAHGSVDQVIPWPNGRQLFEAISSPVKTWVEVPGADHPNILITDFPLYATLTRWALTHSHPDR